MFLHNVSCRVRVYIKYTWRAHLLWIQANMSQVEMADSYIKQKKQCLSSMWEEVNWQIRMLPISPWLTRDSSWSSPNRQMLWRCKPELQSCRTWKIKQQSHRQSGRRMGLSLLKWQHRLPSSRSRIWEHRHAAHAMAAQMGASAGAISRNTTPHSGWCEVVLPSRSPRLPWIHDNLDDWRSSIEMCPASLGTNVVARSLFRASW